MRRRPNAYDARMETAIAVTLGVVTGAAGVVLGGLAVALRLGRGRAASLADLANARARAEMLDAQARTHLAEIQALRDAARSAESAREQAERAAAVAQEQVHAKQRQFDEQRQLLAEAEKKLAATFEAAGAKALRDNNQQFMDLAKQVFEKLMAQASGDVEKKQLAIDGLVKPIRELLDRQNARLAELEQKRETAYARLDESIKSIASSHDGLKSETSRLIVALRRPETRGRWGEMQLRNVVELAGMTSHCDFVEQEVAIGDNGAFRPDMVVRMPGGGRIVVDSKVALEAYLDMLQPDADRDECLRRHCRHVADHFKSLASKQYWKQFERAPKVVVMFMPLESALTAALEIEPDLHAEAMKSNVLIATPTLLVALLRAVAYGWQQEDVRENAREISETGRELYERLAGFAESFGKVGESIGRAAAAFNRSVGTLETRVLVSARKLKALNVTSDPEIEPAPQIEIEVRPIQSPELRRLSVGPSEEELIPHAQGAVDPLP